MHEPLGQPVTILFTDVQGSTQLRARHGDRIADDILHDHEAIVRRAIGAHGGVEVAFLGDGAGGPVGPVQTPFVGRERERADLRRAVGDARAGRGSSVLVSGETGVGKSRLLQEIDAEADARGLRVLVGHSVRDEGQAPYLPFTEMIEQGMVTPRSPAVLRHALGEAAPEIARIAPALRLVVPDIPAPLELPPEQARRYLWLSMREFIGRAAQERPLLLVFEDLHKTLARPEPTAAHADRLTGLAERVAPMAERLGHLGAEFLVVASRIRIEGIYRADLAVIERMGRHVVEICERAGLPWLYVGHLYLGLAADWRGDWETAERELRLADQLEAPGAIGGQSAAHLALHLARAGRADEALALDDWISFEGRLVSTRAAIAAAAARDWDAAERHLATALATAEALGNRIEQVDLGYWRARMLLDRDRPGDREAAAALAAEVAGRYRELGLPGHAEGAAALAGGRGRDA
jgi:class 3 adenylate cyclase